MKGLKKKIVAIVAAIAALFAVSAGTTVAFADDYGASITVSGNVATVTFQQGSFEPNETVNVTVDTDYVSNVEQIANKTYTFKADAKGGLNLRFTLTDKAVKEGATITVTAKGATSGKVYTASAKVPATGTGTATNTSTTDSKSGSTLAQTGSTLAQTGATVAPYAIAAVLLALAGIAAFAVRKQNTR